MHARATSLIYGFLLCLLTPICFAQAPNVLLIVVDDLNDYEGFLNSHPQAYTPNIDQLASQSVSFTNAHANAPICAPSRSSFLLGIYPHTSGLFNFQKWYEIPMLINSYSLPEYLKDNGYHTYGVGKIQHWPDEARRNDIWDAINGNLKPWFGPVPWNGSPTSPFAEPHHRVPQTWSNAAGPDVDGLFARLSENPPNGWVRAGWSNQPYNYVSNSNRDNLADDDTRNWAVNKLQAMASGGIPGGKSNFFMAVGFSRPHTPLVVPDHYFDLIESNTDNIVLPPMMAGDAADTFLTQNFRPENKSRLYYDKLEEAMLTDGPAEGNIYVDKEAFLKAFLHAYLACVAYADEQVGAVLNELNNGPFANNTLVILTSDHGWDFGEKETLFKNSLWETSTRVPFIVKAPGNAANAGQTVDHPVSLIDLYPTIRDYSLITADTKKNASGQDLEGYSLKSFVDDPANGEWEGPDHVITVVADAWTANALEHNYAIRSKDWRYIRYENGQEELYHLASDPNEFDNLIDNLTLDSSRVRGELQAALFGHIPQLASAHHSLVADNYFAWFNENATLDPDWANKPNGTADQSHWYTVNEDNDWSVQLDKPIKIKGTKSAKFVQPWDVVSLVQDLDATLDSNCIYRASFWMRSQTAGGMGVGPAQLDFELWSSPNQSGPYTYRATIINNAENPFAGINGSQYFTGELNAASLSAYGDEYLQVRIAKNEGDSQWVMHVDDISLTSYKSDSFEQWAFGAGVGSTTAHYDADRDGVVNLFEYALGGDPADASSRGHPVSIATVGGNCQLHYPRRKSTSATYVPELSNTLQAGSWSNLGALTNNGDVPGDPDFEAMQATVPMGSSSVFLRLRIQSD